MVSFSCENCGDVLTKKKLDPHRNQCRGASFTCLDCMVHFQGTEYRSHTSCMSEAQKYQGALYREKKGKAQSQRASSSQALVRNAYIEDTQDVGSGAVAVIDAPPHAPSPPPPVNVFDFLVTEETPNTSKVSLPQQDESNMIEDSQDYTQTMPGAIPMEEVFENSCAHGPGSAPLEYLTPAPKHRRERTGHRERDSSTKKSDKKRKRQQLDDIDMSLARTQHEQDETMTDAPPVLHSGLTGGLNRLLTRPDFPPSPDYSGADAGEAAVDSPIKRSKHSKSEKERGRDHELALRKPSDSSRNTRKSKHDRDGSDRDRRRAPEVVRIRRRRSSSSGSHERHHRSSKKSIKAIEYHPAESTEPINKGALVLHSDSSVRAELFLSFIDKGPESERGCSLNKALKRYHRERYDRGHDEFSKQEEEKELWKSIRLKRNDRGEIVLFT
ncbi:hypothetical protein K490DRAFT_71109 [Saccharata proteae CBS 121410]|uniref:Zinc finger C2H2 LYAR-type domain-containing protein n=1 Tax=Saccharata proteae CBS 121410 TaxID=1314787 RepID=A0A9P4M2D3_9PEZI|nr:hypothetical protein K490DRAFT_71109 [Saccharata proteae CBS 121410]